MINSKGWLRRRSEGIQDQFVTTNLDTLATALYVGRRLSRLDR